MAAYNKFQDFVEHVNEGVHSLDVEVLKVYLSNVLPSASLDILKADLAEFAGGTGYTAGGHTLTVSSSAHTTGTYKIVVADVTITAGAGGIAAIQYAVLYNDTPASPLDPLIAWWDNGTPITLADGESVTLDFDAANGVFQMT